MKIKPKLAVKSDFSDHTLLDLLGIISHNVKGPVKYIQFITDYHLEHWENAKPEDFRECAQLINESAKDIGKLLTNMMHWASLQKGELVRHDSTFDLHEVISEEITLHRTARRLKNLAIENLIPKGSVIKSDAHILRLAFQNALSNAIKFSFVNGRIWVEYNEENGFGQIRIRDEGKGMRPEELENLANNQSFTNLGTLEEGGTGFGMRLTQKLVDLLGGRITLESKENAGTSVTFYLPKPLPT